MSADLANSRREKKPAKPTMRHSTQRGSKKLPIQTNLGQGEAEEKEEVATLTATIETNLQQGHLETEVETETESNEALSEWIFDQNVVVACESAGNSTGVRTQSPTAMLWFFSSEWFDLVSSCR